MHALKPLARRRFELPAAIVMSMALAACPAWAQTHESARAMALGGSLVAQPTGLDAVWWNPAAIDLKRYAEGFRFDVVGLHTDVENNSFTVSDYNRYSGAVLSDADKEYILGRVPEGGLRLDARADAQAASFAIGRVAVSFSSQGVAEATISRDALELLLFGNATFDTVNLSGTGGESFVTAGIGFTYAQPVAEFAGSPIYAGATVRYLKGIYGQKIVESYGQIITAASGIDSDARLVAQTANSGTGLAADVGLLYDYGRGWAFGASLSNLVGRVRWEGHPEEHVFTFSIDSLSVLSAGDSNRVQSRDTSYAIAPFTTRLSATLRVGAGRSFARGNFTAQWEQALNDVTGTDMAPRLSAGLEWRILSMLPLRGGLSTGGGHGVGAAGGLGLHVGFFYADLGAGLGSGLSFGNARGASFAFNTGLRF
jgi:hypothetical protein